MRLIFLLRVIFLPEFNRIDLFLRWQVILYL